MGDPVGPDNDYHILDAVKGRDVIVGWGAGPMGKTRRIGFVLELLKQSARQVECLHVTKDGLPGHPLYLPYSSPRRSYPEEATCA